MSADISRQHICVSEGVFASVSGCEEIQHGLSSYHTSRSTCPSVPQQTEGQNCRESVPAREQFPGALLSPSPAVPVCTPAVRSTSSCGPGCCSGPTQLCLLLGTRDVPGGWFPKGAAQEGVPAPACPSAGVKGSAPCWGRTKGAAGTPSAWASMTKCLISEQS